MTSVEYCIFPRDYYNLIFFSSNEKDVSFICPFEVNKIFHKLKLSNKLKLSGCYAVISGRTEMVYNVYKKNRNSIIVIMQDISGKYSLCLPA